MKNYITDKQIDEYLQLLKESKGTDDYQETKDYVSNLILENKMDYIEDLARQYSKLGHTAECSQKDLIGPAMIEIKNHLEDFDRSKGSFAFFIKQYARNGITKYLNKHDCQIIESLSPMMRIKLQNIRDLGEEYIARFGRKSTSMELQRYIKENYDKNIPLDDIDRALSDKEFISYERCPELFDVSSQATSIEDEVNEEYIINDLHSFFKNKLSSKDYGILVDYFGVFEKSESEPMSLLDVAIKNEVPVTTINSALARIKRTYKKETN